MPPIPKSQSKDDPVTETSKKEPSSSTESHPPPTRTTNSPPPPQPGAVPSLAIAQITPAPTLPQPSSTSPHAITTAPPSLPEPSTIAATTGALPTGITPATATSAPQSYAAPTTSIGYGSQIPYPTATASSDPHARPVTPTGGPVTGPIWPDCNYRSIDDIRGVPVASPTISYPSQTYSSSNPNFGRLPVYPNGYHYGPEIAPLPEGYHQRVSHTRPAEASAREVVYGEQESDQSVLAQLGRAVDQFNEWMVGDKGGSSGV